MDAKELDVPVDENIEAEASPQASSHVAPTEMGGAMKTDEEPGEVSNVQVVCRFRPFNEREKELGLPDSKDLFRLGDGFVKFKDSQGAYQTFKVTRAFPPESTQEQVFQIVAKKAMTDLFSGYNASIFAYGQTGSGKSWTMFGSLKDLNYRGLVPRCTETIFQTIKSGAVRGSTITISCSYCEIYQESISDLLKPELRNLQIRENTDAGVYIQGLTREYVGSVVDVYALIALGDSSKRKAATKMNPNSSRSHCCFTITIDQRNSEGKESRAQLNLVDLAGSERVSKSHAEGQSFEEAKKINLSLTVLSQVINALADGSSHVPYRVSKLTRLLQNSLGGNSKTSMVVACSPHIDNRDETLSSLRFAARCSCVSNKVKQNTLLTAAELRAMLERANFEILKATGGKVGTLNRFLDASTQTEEEFGVGEEAVVTAIHREIEEDVVALELATVKSRIGQLTEQLSSKQLEIDGLNQRLIQSNRRLLEAVSTKLPPVIAVDGTRKMSQMPPSKRRFTNFGWNRNKNQDDESGARSARIHKMKSRMSRLGKMMASPRVILGRVSIKSNRREPRDSIDSSIPPVRGVSDSPDHRHIAPRESAASKVGLSDPIDISLLASSPTTLDIAIRKSMQISPDLEDHSVSVNSPSLLHSRDSTDDLQISNFSSAASRQYPPCEVRVEVHKASLDSNIAPHENSLEGSTGDDIPTWKKTLQEGQLRLDRLAAESRVEEKKLENSKLLTHIEDLRRSEKRLAAQCEDQDSVIGRQQDMIRKMKEELDRNRTFEEKQASKIDTLEVEVSKLREQLLRRDNLVDNHSGGANIVVPISDGSVLQPLREQQALGQLGKLLDVFSFGFGGGGEGEEGEESSVGDKLSNVFHSLNIFAAPSDPKPLPVKQPDSGFFKKFW